MLLIILKLIAGFILLLVGGEFLVRGSVSIATKLNMSKLLIGLTIVAFGTSAPELLVSVTAALKGNSVISLGNVIGSNISNIGLILGIAALVYPISVNKQIIYLDFPIMFASFILLFVFMLNGNINRIEAIVLFLSIIAYVIVGIKVSKKNLNVTSVEDKNKTDKKDKIYSTPVSIIIVLVAAVALAFGADVFVSGAVDLANLLKISQKIISLTIVAVGTSLPELFASLIAAIKKESEISVGNIVGSNIFNILAILGIAGIIQPLSFDKHLFTMDLLWMFAFGLALFITFMPFKTKRISRSEAIFLLLLYFVYIYLLIYR